MLKLAISYFYRIRFFTANMIPLSTAVWDPAWFHADGAIFIDNRGVINGYKFLPFVPGDSCNNLCRGTKNCNSSPDSCAFLKAYKEQLDKLDFNSVTKMLENIASNTKSIVGMTEDPTLVLIVYEPPYKPCSERVPLKAWFKEHNYDLIEV